MANATHSQTSITEMGKSFDESQKKMETTLDKMQACIDEIKYLLRQRLGLPQQESSSANTLGFTQVVKREGFHGIASASQHSIVCTQNVPCPNRAHSSTRFTVLDFTQTQPHNVSNLLDVVPTEIGEATTVETPPSHKLLIEGGNFAAVTDSTSVVADQREETDPEVFKDPTPPLAPMNPPAPDTPTEKVGSSKEKQSEWLTAPLNPDTPNTTLPEFTKPKTSQKSPRIQFHHYSL